MTCFSLSLPSNHHTHPHCADHHTLRHSYLTTSHKMNKVICPLSFSHYTALLTQKRHLLSSTCHKNKLLIYPLSHHDPPPLPKDASSLNITAPIPPFTTSPHVKVPPTTSHLSHLNFRHKQSH